MTPNLPWRCPTLTTGRPVASISVREADVLAGICLGHSNKEIGKRLFMSEDSVKTLVRRLLPKLGARNRAHAAALAVSGQLIVHVKGGAA